MVCLSRDPRELFLAAEEASRFAGAVATRKTVKAEPGPAVYVLTAAQNNTPVHAGLWKNLKAYAKHRKARLLVSQFTYNKSAYGSKEIKPGAEPEPYEDVWFAPEIEKHVCNDRLAITRALTFCGELNILPTAERPLSGFENYTGRASLIAPHTKQAMVSVAGIGATKFLYTTGACTLRNYVQKKAGLKAEHHHAYGALVVEVDVSGDWFVRQLRATEDGSFQDLETQVTDGKISEGHDVEAVHWGDVHVAQIDPTVVQVNWGAGGIMDTLQPRYQFLHDTLDFRSRNHHDAKDPFEQFRKWARGQESVRAEVEQVAAFLSNVAGRAYCKTVVVDSNHDSALLRWLKEADFKTDPVNAEFYLKAQKMVFQAIARGDKGEALLPRLLRQMGVSRDVKFLTTDESFVICKRAGGIECGMHGHLGPNGSRGSPRAFSRMGRRVNTGHTHSAGIIDDAFTAGTCSLLKMNYNRGPSSWSHSHIVVYKSGSRAILTCWKGKWRG